MPGGSRAAADVPATLSRLSSSFSLEITPREIHKVDCITDHLERGTVVYVTFLANAPFADTLQAVRQLAAHGLRPVPHLAARAIRDKRQLDEKLAALSGE